MSGTASPDSVKFAIIHADSDGDNELVAAVVGKKIRVINYVVVADVAGAVSFKGGSTVLAGPFDLGASGGASFVGSEDSPAFETAAGVALNINNAAGTDTEGHLAYLLVV